MLLLTLYEDAVTPRGAAYLDSLSGQRVAVVGLARSGVAAARLCHAAGAEVDFESAYGATPHNAYGMCAMRHMNDYGTTSEQLAWIKVAASHHAQYNPYAMLKDVVAARPGHVDAWIEIAKIHRYKGNFRDALSALDSARSALSKAPSDDPRRQRVEALRARYEREIDDD